MANSKISALPSATTPLAGTEVLPVVQGGITEQVSVANLTAGRTVSAASLSLTTTPLAVTSGGTGTATAFTAGSVVFAGASGVYSQNNTNFFWDNTNTRLGIKNSAPTVALEIGTTSQTGNYIQVNGSAADTSYIVLKGSKQYPRIDLQDTAVGGSTFQMWNLGNQLRVGTNPGSAGTAAFYAAAGNSADVTFNGNVVIGTSGKGIDFSATPGTGTSELFADYEEGDWTPTLVPTGTGFTSITYNTQSGKYTKIGRQVTARFFLRTSAITVGAASGSITIGGLPFACGTDTGGTGIATSTFNWGGDFPLSGFVGNGATTIGLYYRTSVNGRDFNIAPSDVGTGANNNDIYMSITYFV
jgi:hypothetical protein